MRLRTGLAVDAMVMGNEARFINDYRGIGPVSTTHPAEGCVRVLLI
jgi:hypothetical protein